MKKTFRKVTWLHVNVQTSRNFLDWWRLVIRRRRTAMFQRFRGQAIGQCSSLRILEQILLYSETGGHMLTPFLDTCQDWRQEEWRRFDQDRRCSVKHSADGIVKVSRWCHSLFGSEMGLKALRGEEAGVKLKILPDLEGEWFNGVMAKRKSNVRKSRSYLLESDSFSILNFRILVYFSSSNVFGVIVHES